MTTPDYILSRYLRGGCLAFAIAAKRQTGLPIFVLVDVVDGREDWTHAFVADEAQEKAIDVRGEMDLDPYVVGLGSAFEGALSVRRTTATEARSKMGLYPTRRECSEALEAFRLYVEARLEAGDEAPSP